MLRYATIEFVCSLFTDLITCYQVFFNIVCVFDFRHVHICYL